MEYYMYTSGNELAHHGIRGMRWGVRRFQNKDGSLTAAGKKRRASEEADLKEREKRIKGLEAAKAKRDKLDAKRAELDARERALKNPNTNKPAAPTKPKSISEMTNDELRAYTDRLRLEKDYHDARKNLATVNPPQVSTGKKFVNSLINDVLAPTAKDVGKKWLTKFMEEKLDLNKNTVDGLRKQSEKLKYTKEIEEYKKAIKDLREGKSKEPDLPEVKTWDDLKKKQEWEKNERDEKTLKETTDKLTNAEKELDKLRKQLEKERNKNKK